ncbi:MAG: hypothetical protein PVJ39_20870 [Gammaproteobacteria bacterium]|jgi:hypothetical protein
MTLLWRLFALDLQAPGKTVNNSALTCFLPRLMQTLTASIRMQDDIGSVQCAEQHVLQYFVVACARRACVNYVMKPIATAAVCVVKAAIE